MGMAAVIYKKGAPDNFVWEEIKVGSPWSGTAMASLYTQAADRKRLAQEAMSKVLRENETITSIPAPGGAVRGAARKT